jgi:hypothetical protein
LTKWQIDKISTNGNLIKCHFDEMANWQKGKLTEWQVEKWLF